MKTLSILALLTASTLLSSLASANDSAVLKGCAAKKQNLQAQIEIARSHGNTDQQAGQQVALDKVNAHCTDDSLRRERENKVDAAMNEVKERQADLDVATKNGNKDKIEKRQVKLAESRDELRSAQEELEK